jgi:hypothetical protein
MAYDWKHLSGQEALKTSRALIGVAIGVGVFGLVDIVWGAVAAQNGRVIDGVLLLVLALVLAGIGIAARRRTTR